MISEEKIQKLCNALAVGASVSAACASAQISATSYYRFHSTGAKEGAKRKFKSFYNRVEWAKSKAESRVARLLMRHCKDDWKACIAFLERRFPESWAPPVQSSKVELTKPIGDEPISAEQQAEFKKMMDELMRPPPQEPTPGPGIFGE